MIKNDIEEFLDYTKNELTKNNVKLKLSNTEKLKLRNGIFCSGYFDTEREDNIILACAINKPLHQWFMVYLHEYGHFMQWKDNSFYFDKKDKRYIKSDEIIDNWIDGKNYPQDIIIKAIRFIQKCELDCEKKVVKLIKKFNFPIDIGEYIQEANSYIHFYNYVLIRRKWIPKRSPPPYEIKNIKKIFPKRFMNNLDMININFINLLDKEYKYV